MWKYCALSSATVLTLSSLIPSSFVSDLGPGLVFFMLGVCVQIYRNSVWDKQLQNSQLPCTSSLSFLFYLGHAQILRIEETGTVTAHSPPAMLTSYDSYCREAVDSFWESKPNCQKR